MALVAFLIDDSEDNCRLPLRKIQMVDHMSEAQIRRSTRACYHATVKAAKASVNKTQSRVMAEALLENNSRDLWTEIKKVNRKSGTIPTTMDDTLGEASVADVFANKFKSLYSCVSYDQCDMDGLLNDVDSLISNVCCSDGCTKGLDIHTDNASRAMRHMSRGKRDGGVGLSTDNLINAPLHELQVHLALIFTTMLRQAILHGACASSTTQKASQVCHLITDSSNYRGIALNSPLCKAFKLVVLDIHHDVLCSSELQFGFKRSLSTTHCTFSMQEVIQYYRNMDTPVYAMYLDASQAFDRIHQACATCGPRATRGPRGDFVRPAAS